MLKKTLLTLIAIASLIMANRSKAALGWTLDECEEHLGTILKEETLGDGRTSYLFTKQGYIVNIAIEKDGTVGRVGYTKQNENDISAGEIEILLAANAKSSWGKPILAPDQKSVAWSTTDGSVFASYIIEYHSLVIYTAADQETVADKAKEDAKGM